MDSPKRVQPHTPLSQLCDGSVVHLLQHREVQKEKAGRAAANIKHYQED